MSRAATSIVALAVTACLALACTGEGMDGGGEGPGLRGRLVGADGQPIVGVEVLACQATTCFYGDTDHEGRFSFEIDPPADVALKTHANLASVPRRGAALVPVDIVDDELIDLGDVYVPSLPQGVVLGEPTMQLETYAVGDGLELSLRSADLMPNLGEFLYDLAAVRLPDEYVPHYAELDGAQVLAVYALHPFAATCGTPVGVRVPVDVPDGTRLRLHTLSHLDGNVVEVVEAVVQGGYAQTGPDEGIMWLTHLIVSM